MSNAISGVGTKFQRWSGSNWVDLAEVSAISGPTKSKETIDVTTLDTTGGYREFIGSFRDGGTVSLTMNFTRATYETMNDDYESDIAQNYRIVLADATETVLEFEGVVTELPLEITVGDKISANATIKVSGSVSLYSNSSDASI